MSKRDFMKIMGEIDDGILERFDYVERKFTAAAARRRAIRAVSALVACLIVIASLVVAPALISDADEGEPNEPAERTKKTTKRTESIEEEPNANDDQQSQEPDQTFECLESTYAIIKIVKITDDKQFISSMSYDDFYGIRVLCKLMYYYSNESRIFITLDWEDREVVELYLEESSVEEMAQHDMMIVRIKQTNWTDKKRYHFVGLDDSGKVEYIPFVDGKTAFDSLYSSRCFGNFDEINYLIDMNTERPRQNEVWKALPKEKFVSGMTYDQVVAFLDACNEVFEIHENSRYGK